jgi:hypothetical protein
MKVTEMTDLQRHKLYAAQLQHQWFAGFFDRQARRFVEALEASPAPRAVPKRPSLTLVGRQGD